MEYLRLTTEKKDNAGHSIITCKFKDTKMCPIHSGGNCGNCDIFNKILEQLYVFETTLEETMQCEVKEYTAN